MNKLFIKSLLDSENYRHPTAYVYDWLAEQNNRVEVVLQRIAFRELTNWILDEHSLYHSSGKFFSIEGIDVQTNYGTVPQWQQPIINQPEIGYLGIITREINGVLHFLLQAKIEPGNLNHVQLSPTLQATKSNYTKVHQGKEPAYLSYFKNATDDQILVDQLQSEQGARFLKKRNRNIIIKLEEDIHTEENFIWLTLRQIKELMQYDNLVNMDTRTVISGIVYEYLNEGELEQLIRPSYQLSPEIFGSLVLNKQSYHTFNDIITFLTRLKTKYELQVKQIPLSKVENWIIGSDSIYHIDRKYFEVIALDIKISNREVVNWSQPMVKPLQKGICAFVCKIINGILHFVIQAKLEAGNFDIIELAPTVQCITGSYDNPYSIHTLPFLNYVLNVDDENIVYDTYQSEEGGRFYKEQNRNLIVVAGEEIGNDLPENYIWMTYAQIQMFIKFNNYVNIQARSLLAGLTFREEWQTKK